MPASQERFFELLMERVREDVYPSHQLLDRIEGTLWTTEQFHTYVELLIDKAGQSWYMSPQLLDRIQRMLVVAASV